MKKRKFIASILAASTILFSSALLPQAHASQANITPSTSTELSNITPYALVVVKEQLVWKGRAICPQQITFRGWVLWQKTCYYDQTANETIGWYEGLVDMP